MKKIITILITVCLMLSLVGCGGTTEHPLYGRFVEIPNEEYLHYDINTNVVYFIKYATNTASMMSPYYSDNGFPYIYDVATNTLNEINVIEEMIKW